MRFTSYEILQNCKWLSMWLICCCFGQSRKSNNKSFHNIDHSGAVVVAQLVERSLPIPEVCSSNPAIGKNLNWTIYRQLYWKYENKEKEAWKGTFKKTLITVLCNPSWRHYRHSDTHFGIISSSVFSSLHSPSGTFIVLTSLWLLQRVPNTSFVWCLPSSSSVSRMFNVLAQTRSIQNILISNNLKDFVHRVATNHKNRSTN